MVLRADDCYADDDYVTDNGRTTVDQGALTPEQKKWLRENHNKPIDAITCLPLTPAQKLYLALCKNGFNLPKALASCGLTEDEATKAQQALKIRDADGVVTEITRPTFVGAALNGYDLQGADLYGADLRHADLREANLQGADLWEADLEFANLQGADLYGADLRHADLREANLQDAKMQGADLYGAKMQGTGVPAYASLCYRTTAFGSNIATHHRGNLRKNCNGSCFHRQCGRVHTSRCIFFTATNI